MRQVVLPAGGIDDGCGCGKWQMRDVGGMHAIWSRVLIVVGAGAEAAVCWLLLGVKGRDLPVQEGRGGVGCLTME